MKKNISPLIAIILLSGTLNLTAAAPTTSNTAGLRRTISTSSLQTLEQEQDTIIAVTPQDPMRHELRLLTPEELKPKIFIEPHTAFGIGSDGNTTLHILAQKSCFDTFGNPQQNFIMADLGTCQAAQALISEHPEWVHALNGKRQTPLHLAASNCNDEPNMVEYLLAVGALPNATDGDGATPLFESTQQESPRIAETLLKAGANPALAKKRQSPLHNAATKIMPQTVAVLLRFNAPVNQPDEKLNTPLHAIASQDPSCFPDIIKIIDLLCGHGAKLNRQNCFGQTPLFLAVEQAIKQRKTEVVHALLKKGAKPSKAAADSQTPIQYAEDKQVYDIAELLRRYDV